MVVSPTTLSTSRFPFTVATPSFPPTLPKSKTVSVEATLPIVSIVTSLVTSFADIEPSRFPVDVILSAVSIPIFPLVTVILDTTSVVLSVPLVSFLFSPSIVTSLPTKPASSPTLRFASPKPVMVTTPPIAFSPVVLNKPPWSFTVASPSTFATLILLALLKLTSTFPPILPLAVTSPCASSIVRLPVIPFRLTSTVDWVCANAAFPLSVSIVTAPTTEPVSTFTVESFSSTFPDTSPTETVAGSDSNGRTPSIFTLSRLPVVTFPPSATVFTVTSRSVPSIVTF